jgi:hypothetical protein
MFELLLFGLANVAAAGLVTVSLGTVITRRRLHQAEVSRRSLIARSESFASRSPIRFDS